MIYLYPSTSMVGIYIYIINCMNTVVVSHENFFCIEFRFLYLFKDVTILKNFNIYKSDMIISLTHNFI